MVEPIEAQSLRELRGLRHGFFTRAGGVSRGIYTGLNCGLGSKDDTSAVRTNRARVAQHLTSKSNHVVTVYQSHSARAVTIADAPPSDALPKADGIVTTTPGLVIGVLTADCAPVLFADIQSGVIGAAHAGWRGAVSGVLGATVREMEAAGATREAIVAAVGPCIHVGNYEVGNEFRDEFQGRNAEFARFFTQPDGAAKAHFDLPGFVAEQLRALGLKSVESDTPCTYENESLFFSYRRSQHRNEADYGRQISAIVLE